MKTIIFKNNFFTLLMSAFVMLSLIACDKDDNTPELPFEDQLIGKWEVNSYQLDGDEWMGLIMESAYIQFDAAGQFRQTVTFGDGETYEITGAYTVDEARKEVSMDYEGEVIVAQIDITGGNKLVWESIQDEYPLVLKATRK